MNSLKITTAVLSTALLLSACERAMPVSNEARRSDLVESGANPAEFEEHDFATHEGASRFQSSQALVRSLAQSERELVQQFDSRYGGALLGFRSLEQRAWLMKRSYPLPHDIVRASTKSDDELLDAYKRGDRQAGFFYLDRISARRGQPGLSPEKQREWDAMADDFLASGTPLAGYAYFNYKRTGHGDLPAALAGLTFAGDLGDGRADLAMMDMAARAYQSDPAQLDPMMLLINYRLIHTLVRSRNPSLLARQWSDFPPDEPPG